MIFPNIKARNSISLSTKNIKEIAWDFDKDEPIIHNNDFVIAEGIEALRVWVYKTLKTQRYKYLIYSNAYGTSINNLIGKMYDTNVEGELKKEISDALIVNDYIDRVSIDKLLFEKSKIIIDLTITTKDGLLEVSVDV